MAKANPAQITFYDEELKERLIELAERQGVKVSAVCRRLLRQSLDMEAGIAPPLEALVEQLQGFTKALDSLSERVGRLEAASSSARIRNSNS